MKAPQQIPNVHYIEFPSVHHINHCTFCCANVQNCVRDNKALHFPCPNCSTLHFFISKCPKFRPLDMGPCSAMQMGSINNKV